MNHFPSAVTRCLASTAAAFTPKPTLHTPTPTPPEQLKAARNQLRKVARTHAEATAFQQEQARTLPTCEGRFYGQEIR